MELHRRRRARTRAAAHGVHSECYVESQTFERFSKNVLRFEATSNLARSLVLGGSQIWRKLQITGAECTAELCVLQAPATVRCRKPLRSFQHLHPKAFLSLSAVPLVWITPSDRLLCRLLPALPSIVLFRHGLVKSRSPASRQSVKSATLRHPPQHFTGAPSAWFQTARL